jgi:hypothetical protein
VVNDSGRGADSRQGATSLRNPWDFQGRFFEWLIGVTSTRVWTLHFDAEPITL